MLRKILLLIFLFSFISCAFSNVYGLLEEEARDYYVKAKEAMNKDDLNTAITFLQKATSLDPYYIEARNDLGIIYEKKAMLDKARVEYKKVLRVQPDYAPTYTNLAMLEESLGNIDKAIFYWKARIAFGRSDDEWTKKAKLKLQQYSPEDAKQIDASLLIEEVLSELKLQEGQKKELARRHIAYGQDYFSKGEYAEALDEFRIATKLLPEDLETQHLIIESTIGIMRIYYSRGIKYYKDRDYESARYNFNKLIQMLPE